MSEKKYFEKQFFTILENVKNKENDDDNERTGTPDIEQGLTSKIFDDYEKQPKYVEVHSDANIEDEPAESIEVPSQVKEPMYTDKNDQIKSKYQRFCDFLSLRSTL